MSTSDAQMSLNQKSHKFHVADFLPNMISRFRLFVTGKTHKVRIVCAHSPCVGIEQNFFFFTTQFCLFHIFYFAFGQTGCSDVIRLISSSSFSKARQIDFLYLEVQLRSFSIAQLALCMCGISIYALHNLISFFATVRVHFAIVPPASPSFFLIESRKKFLSSRRKKQRFLCI